MEKKEPQKITIDCKKELEHIIKKGYLEKQSRFLKVWRKRWFVLTNNLLMTFREAESYHSPTEIISIGAIVEIKSSDHITHRQNTFATCKQMFIQTIITNADSYNIAASQKSEKQQWIGQIGSRMMQILKNI